MASLSTAVSGMLSSQKMINIASQNIANMNTEGYTRQDGTLSSKVDAGGRLNPGSGVELTEIRRISDQYLEHSLWNAESKSSYDSQYRSLLSQSETVIGSDSVSIAKGVDQLFAALSEATNNPESNTAREQIINESGALAERFNQIFDNIGLQERQVVEQSEALIKTANSTLENVASLNKKIIQLEAQGKNTNQLQDQRNLAIQKISESIEVRVNRLDNGSINLTGVNGQPLVSGDNAATLTLTASGVQTTMNAVTFDLDSPGGQLGALQDFQNNFLSDIKTNLNGQAQTIADDMNNQLAAGYDKNYNSGAPLFSYNVTAPGQTLSVTNIAPEELAFIGDDGSGSPAGGVGDNQNLLEILKLRPNFYDAFSSMIGDVGVASRQAQIQADASAGYLSDAQQRRDSLSAVNQDEEAVNLMKFNQAYQANAKVIGVSSDLFDTVLRMF